MSWLYSQALVAEYLEDSCLDGAQCALSRSTPMPQAYLPNDKMTDFSRPSRFGMIFAPLTADLGGELLTWFLGVSRARTFRQRERAQGSGLWKEMSRIIGEVRPRFAFVENSPILTSRGIDRVFGDLAEMGYDAEWGVLGAADVGAPHQRNRIWIVANAESIGKRTGLCESKQEKGGRRRSRNRGCEIFDTHRQHDDHGGYGAGQVLRQRPLQADVSGCEKMAYPGSQRLAPSKQEDLYRKRRRVQGRESAECGGWSLEPDVGRVADGVAARVDRLTALGNGQVPACAAEAFRRLTAPQVGSGVF